MTIVPIDEGNGSGGDGGGSDLLGAEPPSNSRPAPSPVSDTCTTVQLLPDNHSQPQLQNTRGEGEKRAVVPDPF